MSIQLKAVIFDLDGVLVDTATYHYQAWSELATKLGFEFTQEHNERLKGIGRMESLDILLSIGGIQASEQEKVQWAFEKNERYVALCKQMQHGEVLPGVEPLLKELQAHQIKIGLGSASRNAQLIMERVGLLPYFDAIVDGNAIQKGKPDPEVFLLASNYLGVAPTSCLVFEDAQAGIAAAKAAGMYAIGVGDRQTLVEADRVIDSLAAIHLADLQNGWFSKVANG